MSKLNELNETTKAVESKGVDARPVDAEVLAANPRWPVRRQLQYFWQNAKFTAPLLFCDFVALICCHAAVTSLMEILSTKANASRIVQTSSIPIFLTIFVGAFLKLYPGIGMQPVLELRQTVLSVVGAHLITVIMIAVTLAPPVHVHLLILAAGLLAVFAVPASRQIARDYLSRTKWWPIPVLLFAGSRSSEMVWRNLRLQASLGWRPVGIIEDFFAEWDKSSDLDHHYVGIEDDVPGLSDRHKIFWGVVEGYDQRAQLLKKLMDRNLAYLPRMIVVHGNESLPTLLTEAAECSGLQGTIHQNRLQLFLPRLTKRAMDVVVSATSLIMLMPLLLFVACCIKLASKGPILYSQWRYGLDGEKFKVWKFRSMVKDADRVLEEHFQRNPALREEMDRTQKLANDPRITWIGKFIRKTSIDESPQLWNVLCGDMSLVGPRPILMEEKVKYGETFPVYCRVKPGITGLWQVNGRNQTAYEHRLIYASYYVRNWSLWLDSYILLRTIRVVLFCEGAC